LKGTDVILAQICEDLNLSFSLKAVYADKNVWALVSEFPRFYGEPIEEGGIIEALKQDGYHPKIVFDSTQKSCEKYQDAEPIIWVRPLTRVNKFETAYIHYGNEASLNYAYGDVCLVAHVLSSTARTQRR
jgi:hypothetical protein